MISGVRALGRAVGKSHEAVNRNWLKHEAWPFSRRGPWKPSDVPKMLTWAKETLSPDPAGTEASGGGGEQTTKTKAQTLVALERAKTLRFDRSIKEKTHHNSVECQNRRLRQIEDVKRRFLGIPDNLPVTKEIRELIRGKILSALKSLAGTG